MTDDAYKNLIHSGYWLNKSQVPTDNNYSDKSYASFILVDLLFFLIRTHLTNFMLLINSNTMRKELFYCNYWQGKPLCKEGVEEISSAVAVSMYF